MSPKNLPKSIGRYEVIDRIGRGGMGTVYRARDPKIGRRFVAIKLLHLTDEGLRERFLQEAATAGILDHPNIVKVYDSGEHEDEPYIVMEFVEGVTLADQIRSNFQLSLARKLEILRDLCLGLDYAHNMGVIHRDVKPANVMIRKDRIVKILDFGIARVANSGMTQIGMLMGTANYMSPEQVDARSVDRRSDVFSVGLVCYELLAYRPAFTGDTANQVMNLIVKEMPAPIEQVCPDLDPAICAIVRKAIQKDPGQRFQTLAAMAVEITKVRGRLVDDQEEGTDGDDAVTVEMPTPRPTDAHVGEWLKEAAACLDRGNADRASELVGRVLLADPQSADAQQLRVRIELLKQGRGTAPHADSITAALARGRDSLSAGQFESAIRAASEILVKDPTNEAARALTREALGAIEERRRRDQEDSAAKSSIGQWRQQFAAGRRAEAIDALDRFKPRHALVEQALAEMRAEAAAIEQREREQAEADQRRLAQDRWVKRQMDLAWAAIDAKQFDDAIECLANIERIRPDAAGLAELLDKAKSGKAAVEAEARRRREIADTLSRAAAAFAAGRHAEARAALDAVLALDPGHAEALARRQEVDAAIAAALEQERRQAARERELEAAVKTAGDQFAAGEYQAAFAALDRLDPAHKLVVQAREKFTARLEEIEAARRIAEQQRLILARAAAAIDAAQFESAIQLADEASALDPANAEAKTLRAKAASGLEEARRRQQQERADAQARAEQESARTLMVQAKALIEQKPEEAQHLLEQLHTKTIAQPNLAALRGDVEKTLIVTREHLAAQLQAEQTRLREQRLEEAVDRAKNSSSPQASIAILREALKQLDPRHQGCLDLLAERQAELVAAAERLCDDGEYQETLRLLQEIESLGIDAPVLPQLRERAKTGLSKTQPAPVPKPPVAPPASNWKLVAGAAAAVVIIAAVIFSWNRGGTTGGPDKTTITTTIQAVIPATTSALTSSVPVTTTIDQILVDTRDIEALVTEGRLHDAASLTQARLGSHPRLPALVDLSRRIRERAAADAGESKRKAEAARGTGRSEYAEGVVRVRNAATFGAPEVLVRAVDELVAAAELFNKAAAPPLEASVMTTSIRPLSSLPTTSVTTSVQTSSVPAATTSVAATTSIPSIDRSTVDGLLSAWAEAYARNDTTKLKELYPNLESSSGFALINQHKKDDDRCTLKFAGRRSLTQEPAAAKWEIEVSETCSKVGRRNAEAKQKTQYFEFRKNGSGVWKIYKIDGIIG